MVDNVEYSEVRTKRKRPKNMDCLEDELLGEILCRLPSSKTVVMCKSVCKHWAATISQPFFINQFVAHKANRRIIPSAHENGASKYDELKMQMTSDRTFGLVVRNMCGDTRKGLVICFNDPINNPRDLSFSRLPKLANEGLTVVGACNDWLLYQKHERFRFYLYNVQTRQCFVLPSPSRRQRITTRNIGFVCDSNYCNDTSYVVSSNLTPNEAYRACVAVIPYTFEAVTEFPAYLLSPSTGNMWRNVILSLPLRCQISGSRPMFWISRKLYFFCFDCLIGFDPFVDVKDGVIKCHSLPKPPSLVGSVSFFGVFHEQLYMCDREDNGRYRVWILKDYETGQWSLRHSLMGQDWIARDHRLAELVNQSPLFGNAIGFHPANPDVIYVLTRRWIIWCNLSTRKMEIACKLPKDTPCLIPAGGSFQITLPVWPTPVPILDVGGQD
ncbi:hypothetical protein RND81_10G012400 [Saponaria officinalis]|uniref:F-box domain-containing protein n=1 Tax=Saponaria officinalis TaxID=3572 RepID=A0AAW1HY11_SAPOF